MIPLVLGLAALMLVAAGMFAALSRSLLQVSESALERELEARGRLDAGRWMLGRLDQVEWAVSLARTACRIGFAGLLLAAFAGFEEPLTVERLAAAWAVAVALLWAFTSVAAGALGRHAPAKVIASFLFPLRIVDVCLLPLRAVARKVDAMIGSSVGAPDAAMRGEAELVSAIEDTQRQGLIDEHAAEILENAVEFSDITVGAVMTPRPRIEGLACTDDLDAIREMAVASGHSRIPVWRGSLDHVEGILYVKDLVRFLGRSREGFQLRPLLREPIRVPESKPLQEMLRDFQHAKVHFAIVVDEFGGTAGIVTIEDVIEELVGEIRDEHEPASDSHPSVHASGDGAFEASGRAPIAELNAAMGTEFPDDEGFETVAGLLLARLGHIPRAGDRLEDSGVVFEVLEATPYAVKRVRAARAGAGTAGAR